MDKKVLNLLNEQINKELYSAYLYLDISNHFYDEGLDGYGNWYRVQAMEERDHADLILQYLRNSGEKVILQAIEKPDTELSNYRATIASVLEHERYITDSIYKIYEAAEKVKDYRTMRFLDWFVTEQGEEEQNSDEMLKNYELFGTDPRGLFELNRELRARVHEPPSLVLE